MTMPTWFGVMLFNEYSDDEDFCSYGRRADDGT